MNTQEKVIKTSPRFWTLEISGIVLLIILVPFVGMLYLGEKMYVLGGLALLVGILHLISEIKAALRQRITFTKSDVVVRTGKDVFEQSWESIKAVKFVGKGRSRLLVLYSDEHKMNIPCRFFDEAELMEMLNEHLSSNAFHPQAYQRLSQFSEWEDSVTKELSNLNRRLKVSL